MKQTFKRPIDQAIIFNTRAVREDLKEDFPRLEFWTFTLDLAETIYTSGALQRGCVFFNEGSWKNPQQLVIDFKEEMKKESCPLSKLPYASLTQVIGWDAQGTGRKLCEITAGEITNETYKTLQAFAMDAQLNPDGLGDWFNQRGDARWSKIIKP